MATRRGAAEAVRETGVSEATGPAGPAAPVGPAEATGVNEVRLSGRLSGPPEMRELPSGDEVVQLRVVVRRPPDASRGKGAAASKATVDTIDVTCWSAITRRAALRLGDGDTVEVDGSLRRRFYRAGTGVQSRYDVVAAAVRRTRKAVAT